MLPPTTELAFPAEQKETGQQFLRFQLAELSALLPLEPLAEVLKVPVHQVVPLAHMPAWVMGLYNWRGNILWMVDLGQVLGLTPLYQQAKGRSDYAVLVLRLAERDTASEVLGLMVSQVTGIERCQPQSIQPPAPSPLSAQLEPFLRGSWLAEDGRLLGILDEQAIATAVSQG
jgi:positive phototaxis protein PixI